MKDYVAKLNVNFAKVSEDCDAFFSQFTPAQWKSRCDRALILKFKN
jgi:hypothetical protein